MSVNRQRLLQRSLRLLGESGECGGVGNGDLGEHLPVEVDAGLLETVDERGVVHAVLLAGGGDTGDPDSAEVTFLLLSADVGIVAGLHDRFLRGAEQLGLATVVALRQLQGFISSLASHHSAFNTCHG